MDIVEDGGGNEGTQETGAPSTPLFELTEYFHAFVKFTQKAVDGFARAKDPLLGRIRQRRPGRAYLGRNSMGQGKVHQGTPMPVSSTYSFTASEILEGDSAVLGKKLEELADGYVASLMPQVFTAIGDVTEAAGTNIDAGGKPLSADLMVEMLEKMEIDFGVDGQPQLRMVVGPDFRCQRGHKTTRGGSMRSSTESAKNSLLNDVVANFLGTLSELEFFDAFASILRANGFYDVHLLHGATEFGKDFIAKRMVDGAPLQYAIQTKVGNIGAPGWHAVRDQIETIRLSTLSHPSDDFSLQRRAVLATTGRLVGVAPAETQDYKRQYDTSAFEFEVWQLDDLLTMMTDSPESGLAGEPDAPLLGAVAAIYEGTFTEANLELMSRGWANPVGDTSGIWRSTLSAFVLAHRLALHGRRDLAALVGAHLVRSAWARCNNADPTPDEVLGVADAGRGLLTFHAGILFDGIRAMPENPEEFIVATASFGGFVEYPVRCMRILELLGLLGMATADADQRREITNFCASFVRRHPGASHPISDAWAVCIPPLALLVHEVNPELVGKWLQEVCVWVVDHYEPDQAGLAPPWTNAEEEVEILLIGGLPVTIVERRPDSFLAAVLLDLAASLEMTEVYDGLVNEVMAVKMFPTFVEAEEGVGFYQDNYGDVFIEPWVRYDGHFGDHAGWECSEPHRNATPCYLQRIGRAWDLLALSSVLRDRWYPLAWRVLSGIEA